MADDSLPAHQYESLPFQALPPCPTPTYPSPASLLPLMHMYH